tara:strand:- start:126 stop:479 length:354 start_codon:yes stop_codon:yes gene_type:complete
MKGQIFAFERVFNDTLGYKNFNQGYIDSQKYFHGTQDYIIGLASIVAYNIPSAVSYLIPPRNQRLINVLNVNNDYLYSNADYYDGYRYGSIKKKRKRLVQGVLTPLAGIILALTLIN